MSQTLTDAIRDYIYSRKAAKLESVQKRLDRAVLKGSESEQSQAQADYDKANAALKDSYEPNVWLTSAAQRAKQISLSTHSAKFIHSDAKSSSCLCLDYDKHSPYVATHVLPEKTLDASGNAAALDVARLLNLQCDGQSLVDELRAGHCASLIPFSSDARLQLQWFEGLSAALSDARITSHTFAKQVYFPVETNDTYHLLLPLYASSLSHTLHKKITTARFSDEAKSIREARREGTFHTGTDVRFPKTVIQAFGGSKPQNISQLNSQRYGNNFLVSCEPPTWKSQVKPLFHTPTFFNREFSYLARHLSREFRRFLETLAPEQSTFELRKQRDEKYLQPIIDIVFDRAVHYQNMKERAGWSDESACILREHYKLWLDPWYENDAFQQKRLHGNWQDDISQDFARWLNAALNKSKKLSFSDPEFLFWKKSFAKQLKRFDWATPIAQIKVRS